MRIATFNIVPKGEPMAQLNIKLNQDEILQLLSADREDAFRTLLQESLNSILKAESQKQLQAAPYECSEGRTDSKTVSEPEISSGINRAFEFADVALTHESDWAC